MMPQNKSFHSLLPGSLLCLLLAGACVSAPQDYASYVDPFIGTGGHGHTYPGAVVPNGMIQPSPDTRIDEWDACSGYYYADSTINGFSHTHLSGTGCADYGDVLLMPTVGPQDVRPVSQKSQQLPWCSSFSHEREVAEPGYFVCGSRVGLKPEMTERFFRSGGAYRPPFYRLTLGYMLNSFRCRPLRRYMARHFAPKDLTRLRGCNMAFWREDLLRVNGYNEDLTMWGAEDTEIAFRLMYAGVKKRFLKAGGVEYHLWHKPASRENLPFHNRVLEEVTAEHRTWCENGIVKGTKTE